MHGRNASYCLTLLPPPMATPHPFVRNRCIRIHFWPGSIIQPRFTGLHPDKVLFSTLTLSHFGESLQLDVTEYLDMESGDHVAVGLGAHDVDVLAGPIELARVAGVVVQLAADNVAGLDSDGRGVKLKPARVAPIVDPLQTCFRGGGRGGREDERPRSSFQAILLAAVRYSQWCNP